MFSEDMNHHRYSDLDEKTTVRMGENICKWNNWQRIDLQNIHAAHTTQYQNNKEPNQKMDERSK